jgi:alkaline phosphatase
MRHFGGCRWFGTIAVCALALAPASIAFAPGPDPPAPPRRSAVLFIGDGMGPAYVTATRVARGGSRGRLNLDRMPYTALARTYSADSPVTDSAAAASAMACGRKTVNEVLCQDETAVHGRKDGQRLESIALWAKRRGMNVGVVTTARVTHATPAAFYASDNDRDHERAIARAAVASPLDFLLGGGRRYFLPAAPSSEALGWKLEDREDLEATARAKGWTVVDTAAGLRGATSPGARVLGLFASSHLPYEAEQAGGAPSGEAAASGGRTAPRLVEMTRWAIDRLKAGRKPFLLIIEGGRIDHAGHANWARTLVDETAAFDEAIGLAIGALDPRTTLVLVTADHETGGLAINGYPDEKDGLWGTVPADEGGKPLPVLTFTTGPGTKRQSQEAPHGEEDARPSGFPSGSAAHTGVDVALYGWGAGAQRVRGTLDNTDVYRILRAHLEGKVPGTGPLPATAPGTPLR